MRAVVPPELRGKSIDGLLVLDSGEPLLMQPATPDILRQRREALATLHGAGGLRGLIENPVEWQRLQRRERTLPGRG